MKKKRVLVDMSFTIPHHGHIRLIKKAKKFGKVIIALTSDAEIKKKKGYKAELNFRQRKEILLSIKYVDKVLKSPWTINDNFITKNKIDILVHGNDNKNKVKSEDMSKGLLLEKIFVNFLFPIIIPGSCKI